MALEALKKFWRDVSVAAAPGSGAREASPVPEPDPNPEPIPTVWLLGKTGSGKSSIVQAITGDEAVRIGAGFKPCTRASYRYDWPPEQPVLRFLDTRGLGEAGYDPAEDIAEARGAGNALLVAMRVDDPVQNEVLSVVSEVRSADPDWPIIVALTTLHAAYPTGMNHPDPYPFGPDGTVAEARRLPSELERALSAQKALFRRLPGPQPGFVPIDFTTPEDGYAPRDYGIGALHEALLEAGMEVMAGLERARRSAAADRTTRAALTLVAGHAWKASAAGAIPVVGVGGLVYVLGRMLRSLGARYDVEWTTGRVTEFGALIGAGTLIGAGAQFGVRELVKLVPVLGWAVGGLLNAVAAYAVTYGIGAAACVYLKAKKAGAEPDAEAVRAAYREAFAGAVDFRRSTGNGTPSRDGMRGVGGGKT